MAPFDSSGISAAPAPYRSHPWHPRRVLRLIRVHGYALWAAAFVALAVIFYALAALFTHELLLGTLNGTPAGDAGSLLARISATALTLAAAQHFLRIALRAWAAGRASAREEPGPIPDTVTLGVLTAVALPVTAAVAYAEHPGLATANLLVLFTAVSVALGLRRSLEHRGEEKRRQAAVALRARAALACTVAPAPSRVAVAPPQIPTPIPARPAPMTSTTPRREAESPEEPEAHQAPEAASWLHVQEALHLAGVTGKPARALYEAGFVSAALLASADETALLAVSGVGPATIRKLREHFGDPTERA
jgi:hypothetical protein